MRERRQGWTGVVSELIPPNYGIVDGDAFYVTAVVAGRAPVVGERVLCEAVPNTDGGRYAWRCLSVQLAPPEAPPKPAPAPVVRACWELACVLAWAWGHAASVRYTN